MRSLILLKNQQVGDTPQHSCSRSQARRGVAAGLLRQRGQNLYQLVRSHDWATAKRLLEPMLRTPADPSSVTPVLPFNYPLAYSLLREYDR